MEKIKEKIIKIFMYTVMIFTVIVSVFPIILGYHVCL